MPDIAGTAPQSPFLHVQALCVKHGQRFIFKGINFKVRVGELVQITGSNGAGKTTLLRTLLGLQKPHQGQITWSCMPTERLYLGHKLGLKADLTISENMQFLLQLQRDAKSQQNLPLDHSLNNPLDNPLEYSQDYSDQPLQKLSAGQQKRCSLSRVLIQNAKVWLLDEPFTALDQKTVAWMARQIDQHCQAGGSVILSSHQALPNFLSVTQSISL